ncbi:MAG: peptidylprolyl isomerase [Desulfuromonadales bacterium]
MVQAKTGDRVRVHYTGTLEDGSIFDSSEGSAVQHQGGEFDDVCSGNNCKCESNASEPMEFTIGEGKLISKFETAVIGLEPGQNVKVTIAADDAYGQRFEEMVAVINRSEIPAEINPEPGQQMEVIMQDGSPMPVLVTGVTDAAITLDANHPLAGYDLTFDIRLVEIL